MQTQAVKLQKKKIDDDDDDIDIDNDDHIVHLMSDPKGNS